MSTANTHSLRSESSAISLTMELANLEHALWGASLLAELLANRTTSASVRRWDGKALIPEEKLLEKWEAKDCAE